MKIKSAVGTLVLTGALALQGHAQNLIINGSFESPVEPANAITRATPSGWSGGVWIISGNGNSGEPTPEDGVQYDDIGNGGSDPISQTFNVPMTGQYSLTWFDNEYVGYEHSYTVSVTGNTAASYDSISTGLWISRSLTVSLNAGANTLVFQPTGGSSDTLIDNVSMLPYQHAQTNYPNLVMSTPNLLGYWRFSPDMPTNSSFGTNTCTFSGDAQIGPAGSGPALPGIPTNTAVLLDGNGDFVTTTLVGGLNTNGPYANQGSIIAWFKLATLPSTTGRAFFIAGESSFGNDFDFQIEPDNNIRFYTDGGSSTAMTNALTASDTNGWHFLAATFTANTSRKIYLDGVLVGSSTPGGHNPAVGGTFSIGDSHVFTGRYFQGAIDEVAIFNRELTGMEVADLYNGYSSVPVFTPYCTNLTVTLSTGSTNCATSNNIVGWWKADGNMLDSSGNNNNGSTPNSVNYVTGAAEQAFQLGLYNSDFDQLVFSNYHRVDLGALPQLYSASGFTMAGWIRLPHLGYHEIFSLPASIPSSHSTNAPYNSVTASFGCQADVGLIANFSMGLDNGVVVTNNASANTGYFSSTNQWLHLAFTWNNADGIVHTYTNGILAQTTPNPNSIGHTLPTLDQRSHQGIPVPAALGEGVQLYSEPDAPIWRDQNNFETHVDEFQLYNRALSSSEIMRVYNGDSTVTSIATTNCVASSLTTNLDFCTVPGGKLQILNGSPSQVQLFWPSQINAFYLLQGSDELTPINWTTVWGAQAGNGSNVIVPDSTTSRPRRFYRLLSTEQ